MNTHVMSVSRDQRQPDARLPSERLLVFLCARDGQKELR